jgi:heme exporter protein B
MMRARRQMTAVARRDLARERRTGEVVWVTVPFGAVALLLIPLAVGTDVPMLQRVGPGLYWVIVLLFGVLISVRQANGETLAQRDQLALTGMDPALVFTARAAASFVLLLVFEAVLGVVAFVLYDIPVVGWWLIPVSMVVVAAGLSLLGTLAAGIVSTGRAAAALVPLLVAPLSIPLLIGATQAAEALRLGRSSLTWVLMMIVSTLVLAIAGVLSARPLQETG